METKRTRSTTKPEAMEFKSYYVVWKRIYRNRYGNTQIRLNRTMQYGNPDSWEMQVYRSSGFKSYYVVWKP